MRDMNRINISSHNKFNNKITLESIHNSEDLFGKKKFELGAKKRKNKLFK